MYISSVECGKDKSAFFYFHTFGGPFHHSDLVTSARAFQLHHNLLFFLLTHNLLDL